MEAGSALWVTKIFLAAMGKVAQVGRPSMGVLEDDSFKTLGADGKTGRLWWSQKPAWLQGHGE